MKRATLILATLGLLLGGVGKARADFQIVTDQASFVSNDSAGWGLFQPTSTSPTTSGLGTFSWGFLANSFPYYDSLVTAIDNYLFVGTSSFETGDAAFYVVNASVNYGGPFVVTGLGFNLSEVSPATQLTVYDVQGDSQTFTLDGGFVGVLSDVSITGFQFTESSTDIGGVGSQAIFRVSPVYFEVAPVPVPSGLILTLTGVLCIGGYAWQQRKRAAA